MSTFSIDVSKWVKETDDKIHNVIRMSAFEIFKRVILRTPVDTGRLRANWSVSIGYPYVDEVESVDPSGAATVSAASKKVLSWDCQTTIFMCNNASYARTAEYGGYPNPPKSGTRTVNGFSIQAPQGMVRVSVAEFDDIVRETALKAKP